MLGIYEHSLMVERSIMDHRIQQFAFDTHNLLVEKGVDISGITPKFYTAVYNIYKYCKYVKFPESLKGYKLSETVKYALDHGISYSEMEEYLTGRGNSDRLRTGIIMREYLSIEACWDLKEAVRYWEAY